jgi:Xaa-Pro aminopeptidase
MNAPDNKAVFCARIAELQAAMARHGVQALVVPAGDPHVSEYPCAHWEGRRWLCGFTGSVATLVVFADRAALVPEPIYWEQADTQLAGTGVQVVKNPLGGVMGTVDWLPAQLPRGTVVAVNGNALPLFFAQALEAALARQGVALRGDLDLLGAIWQDRPPVPDAPVFEHPLAYAATRRAHKLQQLRASMQAMGATHHLVSSLEDIAWLSNLRGMDSPNTPVFLSHLLVDGGRARLFMDLRKLAPELSAQLQRDGYELLPYAGIQPALAALGEGDVLLLDPRRTTMGLRQAAGGGCRVIEAINPSTMAKSRKSAGEAAQIREAMAEDGAAMCEFYAWFEATLGREPISEVTVHERLTAARRTRRDFVMLSFPTIAGFNAHGALPHYTATAETDVLLQGDGLLLVDSGAQYLGATTDITRMWKVGTLTPAMKRDVSMVLKSHIALTRIRFPRGTLSTMLDAVARVPMWAEGMNYFHGTGHGVGYCLGVHEGPQTFRQAIPDPSMAMEPGMVTSIEPAVYRPGQWGVRIENLVLAVPAATTEGSFFGEFLAFETLTLCPIDTRCLERSLLSDVELQWLNAYHATVRERLAPRVQGAARDWLLARTEPF